MAFPSKSCPKTTKYLLRPSSPGFLPLCYGEVFDESLADEGRSIIASWDSLSLTPKQQEAVDEFQNVTDNPYPWEYIDE